MSSLADMSPEAARRLLRMAFRYKGFRGVLDILNRNQMVPFIEDSFIESIQEEPAANSWANCIHPRVMMLTIECCTDSVEPDDRALEAVTRACAPTHSNEIDLVAELRDTPLCDLMNALDRPIVPVWIGLFYRILTLQGMKQETGDGRASMTVEDAIFVQWVRHVLVDQAYLASKCGVPFPGASKDAIDSLMLLGEEMVKDMFDALDCSAVPDALVCDAIRSAVPIEALLTGRMPR